MWGSQGKNTALFVRIKHGVSRREPSSGRSWKDEPCGFSVSPRVLVCAWRELGGQRPLIRRPARFSPFEKVMNWRMVTIGWGLGSPMSNRGVASGMETARRDQGFAWTRERRTRNGRGRTMRGFGKCTFWNFQGKSTRWNASVAVREGFEPSLGFHLNTLSKRAPSTTRPPHHAHQM